MAETHDKSLQYWWLSAHPTEDGWIFTERPVGEIESYSLYNDNGNKRKIARNFLEAAVGDTVIGYATAPRCHIEALLKVAAEQDGSDIYFEKTEILKVPVTLEELRKRPELRDMKFFRSRGGSLFDLKKSEYDCIMKLIRAKNP